MFHVAIPHVPYGDHTLGGSSASMFEHEHAIMARLRITLDLIERMLQSERERYFDALALKRCGRLNGNVTARFFSEAARPAGSPLHPLRSATASSIT